MTTFLVYSKENISADPIVLDEQSIEIFFEIEDIDLYTVIEIF